MSGEATIFECPYNLFLKQRLEFVVICQDHLEASIMRIIEYEMIKRKEAWQDKATLAVEAKKTPPREPRDYWVRLSQGQIIAKLYLYDSAKLEKPEDEDLESEAWVEYRRKKALSISKSTLRKAIDALIDKGFLLMRSKPGDEFGAPIYTLHRANVQKAMKALPTNPYMIFNGWGVSNFESGGESQNLEVPPPKIETPTFKNAKSHFQNLEVNKDIYLESLEEENLEDGSTATSGEVAPTHAALSQKVAKRITNPQIQAISQEMLEQAEQEQHENENETQYHIANRSAIGNEERVIAPALSLPSKGVSTHDRGHTTVHPGSSVGHNDGLYPAEAHEQITSEQAPGTNHQAHPLSVPTPAQAESPPAGSASAPTAQASGHIPKRPRGKQPLVALTLMGSQVMQWIGEIRGAKPRMTQGNIRAVNALADTDGISKEALVAYYAYVDAQKWEVDLLTAAGETGNDKVGFLSFESNWPKLKRKLNGQSGQAPPQDWVPDEKDYSVKAQLWRQEHMTRSGK